MKRRIVSLLLATLAGVASGAGSEKPKTIANDAIPQKLSYANIVSHFKAAGLRATEVQPRCTIFFEGEWQSASVYNYGLIIVENSDEDVQVTFYLTDAHEMIWTTEFLDAPFFTSDETAKLFDVLYSGGEVCDRKVGRFRVDFHRWQPKHAEILVFSFTPVGR